MTDNHDRAIGRIEGKLDRLIADFERTSEKRAEQYKRIEKIERTQERSAKIDQDIIKRLEKVEHPVAEFNKWRERAIGAVMLISLSAALIGGTVVSFGITMLERFITWLKNG